jgi:hypothetical protein
VVAAATLARCNPRSTPPPCYPALRQNKPTSTPRPVVYTSRQTHIACVPPSKHSAMFAATLTFYVLPLLTSWVLTLHKLPTIYQSSSILSASPPVSASPSHRTRQPHHRPTMPPQPCAPCAWSSRTARQRTACVAAPAAAPCCMVAVVAVMVAMVDRRTLDICAYCVNFHFYRLVYANQVGVGVYRW